MKKIYSILLFIFTLIIFPILIVIDIVSPRYSEKIKKALLNLEKKIEGEATQVELKDSVDHVPVSSAYKEPTVYVPKTEPEYQPWNQIPDFSKDDEFDDVEEDDIDLAGFRYVLDYKDKYGNVTTRGVDILGVHKVYGNNRWYFIADTIDGERTFKSQRVISLKDQWFNTKYNSSKAIREHILSEYDVIEDVED